MEPLNAGQERVRCASIRYFTRFYTRRVLKQQRISRLRISSLEFITHMTYLNGSENPFRQDLGKNTDKSIVISIFSFHLTPIVA